MRCYLRIGSDTLEEADGYRSIAGACEAFHRAAEDLARWGQAVEGSIHIAPTRAEVVEYPDYVLSLGARGGLRKERA